MTLKHLLAALFTLSLPAQADPDPTNWQAVTAKAQGQTVYWHAWGGSTTTNSFINWAGTRVQEEYGITLKQVKLTDIANTVSRVLAEKTAGQDEGGAADLIWINGASFAAMKEQGLLFGNWAEKLPNWALVDHEGKNLKNDFTVPVEGYESPWAMAQVVMIYDSARVPEPPKSMTALLDWAKENPGRFTFPQPPNFLGTTFLKQALIDLSSDTSLLALPVTESNYQAVSAPLWAFLDALTPLLWRAGRAYPQSGPRQLQLIADGEIDIAISFSPDEASAAIANDQLPPSTKTYVLEGGTIGNASFVAIPYNSSAKEAAMVVANFLLSPEAQLRAQDPEVLGYGTVLSMEKIAPEYSKAFEMLKLGPATLSPAELGAALPEPHPSWATHLSEDWISRYGVTQ